MCLRRVLALLQFCCCFCCLKFSLSCILSIFLLLLFQIHHFVFWYICCCFCCSKFTTSCSCLLAKFVGVFVVANFLASCFATFVVVIPNSPLCVLLHLLSQISSLGVLPLLLLLFQIRHFVFCYICCLVAPKSPLRDLQLLLLPVLLLLLHLASSPPLH